MQWDSNRLAESIHYKVFGVDISPDMPGWESQEFYEIFMEIFPDSVPGGTAEFWVFQEQNQDDLSPVVYESLKATGSYTTRQVAGWDFVWGEHPYIGSWCYFSDISGCNGGQLLVRGRSGAPHTTLSVAEITLGDVTTYFGELFKLSR